MIDKKKYKYYLITRFNLKQNEWAADKYYNPLAIVDKNWLEERFSLFETYCLPSVQAQTNKEFKWLVYFDIDTPDNYKTIIKTYEQNFPNFSGKFIPSMQQLLASIKNDITAEVGDIVITSRVDNDDSLHEDYIKKIYKCVNDNEIKNGIIDIQHGYCLEVKSEPVLYSSIQYSNAFITYVETYRTVNDLVTVMGKSHDKWAYSVETFAIKNEKLWMQIIHGKNAMNTAQGLIINKKEILSGFNLNANFDFSKKSLNQFALNQYVVYPIYLFKKQLKKWLIKFRAMKSIY